MSQADLSAISCNVCKQSGGLHATKVHRFSTPLVVIGWLLLVPSLLGMSCGACGLFATGQASSETTDEIAKSYERRLAEIEGVSAQLATRIATMPEADPEQLRRLGLNEKQIAAVERAHDTHWAGRAGAAIGGGLLGGASIAVILSSFIGGVFGWILVLNKKVIACSRCQGVHSEAV